MGARQSKRSVDISNPPKKGELDNGGVEDGKLERLEEGDVLAPAKATQNGTAPHEPSPVTEEAQPVPGDTQVAAATDTPEKKADAENADESLVNGSGSPESPAPVDKSTTEDSATPTPDKGKKKKEKSKLKWSFRSISFSKKDKSKPNLSKDEAKNGNVSKEEPVPEVVEAEAAATTEAIPVKDGEGKKDEPTERPAVEEEKKKEEKSETSTEHATPASPTTPAPVPVSASEPVASPAPVAVPELSSPAVATPPPPAVTTPPPPAVATPPPALPVQEPLVEAIPPPPAVEAIPEPVVEKPVEVPVVESVLEMELPPPLPASPPPTEAPPPTPIAPTPTPASLPDVAAIEAETQETEVVGGGGESMAEPVDLEPVLDTEEKLDEAPLVNGIGERINGHDFVEEISEKVEIVTESFKTISVTESLISTQVTDNSDEKEQTASAAE